MSDRPIEQPHRQSISDDVDDARSRVLAASTNALQELGRELETLLDGFCSDAQQRFILDQQIASPQQLQRVRQTIQQIRNASGDLIESHNSEAIRQSLMRVSLEMLEYYRAACERRQLLHVPDRGSDNNNSTSAITTTTASNSNNEKRQLTAEWHHLSEMFEHKAKEQARLAHLYERIGSLRKAWKRPRHMERLLTALVATNFDLPPGAYLVVVDRHNYCQLGLKRKAIGSRQLIFDTSQISRKEQMDEVARVCDRFASVFARNAQHNLAQIEAQVQSAQLTLLASRLERLQREIYQYPTYNIHLDDLDGTCPPSGTHPQPSNNNSSSSSNSVSGPPPLRPPAPAPPPPPPPPPPLLPDLQGASSLIYIQDQHTGLQNLPMPSFVPTPWEWPDLLKVRRPYAPVFFGLFRHRRRSNPSRNDPHRPRSFWYLFSRATMPQQQQQHGTFSTRPPGNDDDDDDDDDEVTFASVSFQSLCSHFCRRGRQFYEDVATHAQIKQDQDRRMLQEIGRDLVNVYAAIQLEASRAHMHRILAILHDMALIENQLSLDHHQSTSTSGGPDRHAWQTLAAASQQPSSSWPVAPERENNQGPIESNITSLS